MFDDDKPIFLCYSCDAEFSVEPLTDEDPPSFCPFCGSELDMSNEDEFEED